MDVNRQEPAEKTPESANIAALLIAAREKMSLSAEDIALQMNLTSTVINKIELNQFEQDIPLAFIRGYVRSYAQLVGLDVAFICAEFDAQTSNEEKPIEKIKVVSNFNMSRKEVNSNSLMFKSVTLLIVISLMGLAGWEAWKRFTPSNQDIDNNVISLDSLGSNEQPEVRKIDLEGSQQANQQEFTASKVNDTEQTPEADNSTSESVTSNRTSSNASPETSTDLNGSTTDNNDISNNAELAPAIVDSGTESLIEVNAESQTENLIDKPNQIPVPQQQSQSVVNTELTANEDVLPVDGALVNANFVFSGDCWVQVKDANDNVLAIGVKHAGKKMNLQGVAPLSVILGEPSVVELSFQGENYSLSQYRAGRTAQFILE